MNTANNQRARITKALIEDSYISLLEEKPYARITVKDICMRSSLNRSTFYFHYDSSEAVLKSLEQSFIQSTRQLLAEIGRDEYQHTSDDTKAYLLHIRKHSRELKALFSSNGDPHFAQQMMQITYEQLCGPLNISLDTEKDRFIAEYILNGCLAVLRRWLETDCEQSISTIQKILVPLSRKCLDAAL